MDLVVERMEAWRDHIKTGDSGSRRTGDGRSGDGLVEKLDWKGRRGMTGGIGGTYFRSGRSGRGGHRAANDTLRTFIGKREGRNM